MGNLSLRYLSFVAAPALVAGMIFYSCDRAVDEQQSTFGLIQSKILNPTCAISGCHASKTDNTFLQHNLVLEQNSAYGNLVGKPPVNAKALADGLLLVKAFDSEGSFLFHKLHTETGHHAQEYGNPMPLGLPALSHGQLEFIRIWIDAGAPQTGNVADAALLEDTSEQKEDFEPLAPPATGKGFQVSLPEFLVPPNVEREFFVYKKLGNPTSVFVNRFEIKMRRNSHHFILYDFDPSIPPQIKPLEGAIRDIYNPNGSFNFFNMQAMSYHVFIMGTQTPYLDYQFPDGVAVVVPAGAMADLNSHYVNKQSTAIPGEVYVNLHTIPASNVSKVAKAINFPNQSISLPANQRTTLSKSFQFEKAVSVISITSHTHQLGEKFVVKIYGGARQDEIVYTNLDWHHPGYKTFTPPITLQAGEGLTSEITYNNTTNKIVSFGLTSENEMGIIFGYYYEN